MSFDPEVLFDLSFENLLRLTHALAGEVSAVGHNSDANQIVVLRDIPEPALLRDKSDRGRAGSDVRLVTSREIKGLAGLAGFRNELDAVFFDERRLPHFFNQSQPFQGMKGERQQ